MPDLRITNARFPEDSDALVRLLHDYRRSLTVDLSFQGFEDEVAGMPGAYAPPDGRLLLARAGDDVVGCVALRRHDARTVEMKRLFLRPEARGLGVGRTLVERAVAEARQAGYRALVLDTLPEMGAAIALYERMGFRPVAPYTANPVPGARFLGLAL